MPCRYLDAHQQQQQEQQQQQVAQGQDAAEAYLAALSLSSAASPGVTQRSAAALSPSTNSSPSNSSPTNNSSSGGGSNLADQLATSQCHKARLLHYFPPPSSGKEVEEGVTSDAGDDTGDRGDQQAGSDAWCGWHLDHGTLTGG
jgi:hypothetical protein